MSMHSIPPEAEEQLATRGRLVGGLSRGLLKRYPVWPIVDHLANKTVPQHRASVWYNLGGIALFFLGVQIISGILLMIYYRPGQPWSSVQIITMEIPFGGVIRSVHHWSANLMVLTVFMHAFSAFFMKAYRPPRELTWLTGMALIGLTMLFGFSGYLLPWDELSFFATRVGMSEAEKIPPVGVWLATLARGGSDVTVATIGRFYALHVVVLPLVMLGLIGVHLLFVQIQGISEPDSFARRPAGERRYHKFFSEFLFAEIPIWLLLSGLLVALATLWPRALMPEADPFAPAPAGIKPEWYFLSQFQLLKLFPGDMEMVGILFLALAPILVVIVPFIDRATPADWRGRLVTGIGIVALLGLIVLTIWGWLS